jgi:hypothetical protein
VRVDAVQPRLNSYLAQRCATCPRNQHARTGRLYATCMAASALEGYWFLQHPSPWPPNITPAFVRKIFMTALDLLPISCSAYTYPVYDHQQHSQPAAPARASEHDLSLYLSTFEANRPPDRPWPETSSIFLSTFCPDDGSRSLVEHAVHYYRRSEDQLSYAQVMGQSQAWLLAIANSGEQP